MGDMLQRCYQDAKRMMESLIAFELAYINTNHPDFIDVSAVLIPPSPLPPLSPTPACTAPQDPPARRAAVSRQQLR